jgi:hypothetical protein
MHDGGATGPGLERLELRMARLKVTFRFTFAFHAREVRFERDAGDGFERVFPETFSFHAHRHDPTELTLQLEDLITKPALIDPRANARDAQQLVIRLLTEAPLYLDEMMEGLESSGRLNEASRGRVNLDVALLSQILRRFIETHDLPDHRRLRVSSWVLARRQLISLSRVMRERVDLDYLDAYVRGEVDPIDPADDPSESGFFHVVESGDSDAVNRMVVRMTERAFYVWLGVCLDEENQAFEKEGSPFGDRESEVLRAIRSQPGDAVRRGDDLVPFLRRRDRDSIRVLGRLERWFLRQYDIPNASAIIHHLSYLDAGVDDGQLTLTWHTPRIHLLLLAVLAAPFVGAAFAYDRAPRFFDLLFSAEVLMVNALAVWFLVYRFCLKRDLSFFHASVPRIAAGIIVGYLPVFLIDEVWDLASRSVLSLALLVASIGLVTLLYIYVEVQRRLGSPDLAFRRARGLFLLGVVQATAVGIAMTSLVGPFMVSRNWSPGAAELEVDALRPGLEPMVGALPPIVGVEPFYGFPPVLLVMTLLSFFIGVFLQLMWEELPITEPL